jgi:hypothetical protein
LHRARKAFAVQFQKSEPLQKFPLRSNHETPKI